MRGNYLLYALEAILFILALTTFAFTSQQALQSIILGILVVGALHMVISGVTVCSGWKKWTMIGLSAPAIVTSIIMLIVNLQTDADAAATPPTVAIGASWKIALIIVCGILPLANAVLVGDGSQWRCTSGLVCTNSAESDALKTSVRKYLNTANDTRYPISGPLAKSVNFSNLNNDYLEELKIAHISVNDSGNDVINCLGFKQAVDAQQRALATQQRRTQIAAKQEDARQSFQAKQPILGQGPSNPMGQPVVNYPLKAADPSGKVQYGFVDGDPNLFGMGAKKVQLVPNAPLPPPANQPTYQQQQAAQKANQARVAQLNSNDLRRAAFALKQPQVAETQADGLVPRAGPAQTIQGPQDDDL